MARKGLLECSFLIPIRRDSNLSDGRMHGRIAWSWLEGELEQLGGATRSRELYEGCWYLDPDTAKRVKDLSRKYFVAVRSREVERLRAVLRRACAVCRQKCLYLSIAGVVEFVEGLGHEAD